jgi:hypothetical protein
VHVSFHLTLTLTSLSSFSCPWLCDLCLVLARHGSFLLISVGLVFLFPIFYFSPIVFLYLKGMQLVGYCFYLIQEYMAAL